MAIEKMETQKQTRAYDFIIVGSGIAGLRAAIELAESGRVLLATKDALSESNTAYAQGGIAVALSGPEDVALHLKDTLAAGDGLVDRASAEVLVAEGPARVQELLAWDTRFDRKDGKLVPTLEGAHSLPRVLHANGDATGAEISRALIAYAKTHASIELREGWLATDLLLGPAQGQVLGVELVDPQGCVVEAYARATLLATGGAGQVFSDTTNPLVATGDGIAMAARAGAQIEDMEFYQFHPTAFSLPGVERFLLSEALRGEGAQLRNAAGERFMERYHPLRELAPRDVVARAITREGMAQDGSNLPVYLDMREVQGVNLTERFPGISAFLAGHGLRLDRDLIPVRPAAHYLMGGVRTDHEGRTSLPRLYAAGEAACTGVHGANRLASNSLLEGLVFGARAAQAMMAEPELTGEQSQPGALQGQTPEIGAGSDLTRAELQNLMWQKAGLLREADGLASAQAALAAPAQQPVVKDRSRAAIELRNLHEVARCMVKAALARQESRGAHYRNDFAQRDDEKFQKHSVSERGQLRFL